MANIFFGEANNKMAHIDGWQWANEERVERGRKKAVEKSKESSKQSRQ